MGIKMKSLRHRESPNKGNVAADTIDGKVDELKKTICLHPHFPLDHVGFGVREVKSKPSDLRLVA